MSSSNSSVSSVSASLSSLKLEEKKEEVKAPEKLTLEFVNSIIEKNVCPEDAPYGLPGISRFKSGGMQFTDTTQRSIQMQVLKDLVSQFGSNLLQGKSVINVSFPVKIFEPRSFLQRLTDSWVFAPAFLNKAALATDAVERFKYCIAFAVSGLHLAARQLKPFNPILGETYQSFFKDGTALFMEQTSHHPPISSFSVTGPQKAYHFWGSNEVTAHFRPTGLSGCQVGVNNIDFPDGTRITYQMPTVWVTGVIFGDRQFYWSQKMTFEDKKNGLVCTVNFDADKATGLSSLWSSSGQLDVIRGEICVVGSGKKGEDKKCISKLEGSWMESVSFDGKTYWKRQDVKPFKLIDPADSEVLPSDCRFREDLSALVKGDQDLSQKMKETLEEKQRYDAKLRQQSEEQRKKIEKLMAEQQKRGASSFFADL
eukprot:TRINITY_DN736_c0_g1_i1.p1 TRINITY_DN736_c0_g1~~TRINITY_DN736_c0_g1_i1.p1  ORF type:complete len:445 (-),score=115.35 TRINITY_DN736_c0_g1_i1:164-1438(-)